MKHYRPLLVPSLDLSLGGLRIRGVRLNRHTPESQIGSHCHEFDQLIACLQGRCQLSIEGKTRSGRPGAVFAVPAGTEHGFLTLRKAAPLCLVIDLDFAEGRPPTSPRADLTAPELSMVKGRLSTLFRNVQIETPAMRLPVAAVICDVLDPLLKTVGCVQREAGSRHGAAPQPVARMLDRLLERPGADDFDIAQIAERLGYQQDHLNRRLKTETGLTIGQYRSRYRLKKAQQFLRAGRSVQETAELSGFPDKNYFSRWFRLQAGVTATTWRRENSAETAAMEHPAELSSPLASHRDTGVALSANPFD